MPETKRDTREARPLLALEPVFILDEVGEDGVEGEERSAVEVCVPGEGAVQRRTHNFAGLDYYRSSVEKQSVSGMRIE